MEWEETRLLGKVSSLIFFALTFFLQQWALARFYFITDTLLGRNTTVIVDRMSDSVRFHKLFAAADEFSGVTKQVVAVPEDTAEYEQLFTDNDRSNNGSKASSRIQASLSDIDRLRIVSKTVEINDDHKGELVVGVYSPNLISQLKEHDSKIHNKNDERIIDVGDWMNEIRSTMQTKEVPREVSHAIPWVWEADEGEPDKAPSKAYGRLLQEIKRRQAKENRPTVSSFELHKPLNQSIVDYRIFHPDLVDLRQIDDPLDVTIPLPASMEDELEQLRIDTHGQVHQEKAPAGSNRTAEPSKLLQRVVDRHHKHRRPFSDTPLLSLATIHIEDDSMASKYERDRARMLEKADRIRSVQSLFDTTQSLIKSAMRRGKRGGDRGGNRTANMSGLTHSSIALQHRNTKPDLYEVELKYFHRPRMSATERQRSWEISFQPPLSKKARSNHSNNKATSSSSSSQPPGSSVHTEQDKNNLSLYNDHPYMLLEYIEETPPLVLNGGMASVVYNYFRSTTDMKDEEDMGALSSKKRERVSQDGLVQISKNLARPLPRHILPLLSLRNEAGGGGGAGYEGDIEAPRFSVGQTKVLTPEEDSPFLGDIEGGEVQPAFSNNLFRAPLFEHTSAPSDFLLVRVKITPTTLGYVAREIPLFYLAGQMEPLRAVPAPSRRVGSVLEKFITLTIIRLLGEGGPAGGSMSYQELQRHVLKYSGKEANTPHLGYIRDKFREIVNKICEIDEGYGSGGDGGARVYLKEFSAEMEHDLSIPVLSKSFLPEEVCEWESSYAAQYR